MPTLPQIHNLIKEQSLNSTKVSQIHSNKFSNKITKNSYLIGNSQLRKCRLEKKSSSPNEKAAMVGLFVVADCREERELSYC